jgi:hypothetical protein
MNNEGLNKLKGIKKENMGFISVDGGSRNCIEVIENTKDVEGFFGCRGSHNHGVI